MINDLVEKQIMNKQLIFFCPNILNDGLKTTLSIYLNYFSKYFDVYLITNTFNDKYIENFNKRVKIINPKIRLINNINFFNIIFCTFLAYKCVNKNSIIFSMHNHLLLLMIRYFDKSLKIILRTPNAIMNDKKNSEYKYLKRDILFNNLFIKLYNNSNLIVTFSKKNQLFLSNKLENKKIIHINNYFQKFSGRKKIKKIYNIFFVGSLSFIKDPEFFLRNTIQLLKIKRFKIHIIGEGPYKKRLFSLSNNYRKHVTFYNHVKNPFRKYSKRMDLLCITSRFDGTPNVLGEAMSYKIPCLAPKGVGLCNELLRYGKYGYLYNPEDSKSFQRKILYAIENYGLSIKKANLGYRSLDRFNKKNTLQKLKFQIEKI